MPDVRLIDSNVVISYIDDCIAVSQEEREDAKSRGNDCEANYNAGEIQMARRIKRQINLGTPTIDAAPVVHGRWLRENIRPKSYLRVCSMCKKTAYFCGEGCSYKYCPNCGAKMDGGAEG